MFTNSHPLFVSFVKPRLFNLNTMLHLRHSAQKGGNQNHRLNRWFVRPFKGLLLAASQDALKIFFFCISCPTTDKSVMSVNRQSLPCLKGGGICELASKCRRDSISQFYYIFIPQSSAPSSRLTAPFRQGGLLPL